MDARSLDGSHWVVTAINGQATPASNRFTMSFSQGRLSARFGCNGGGGSYTASGNVIRPGPMLSTQMACESATDAAGPDLMAFERWGFGVLGKPITVTWKSGTELTLRNAAGAIDLRRAP